MSESKTQGGLSLKDYEVWEFVRMWNDAWARTEKTKKKYFSAKSLALQNFNNNNNDDVEVREREEYKKLSSELFDNLLGYFLNNE